MAFVLFRHQQHGFCFVPTSTKLLVLFRHQQNVFCFSLTSTAAGETRRGCASFHTSDSHQSKFNKIRNRLYWWGKAMIGVGFDKRLFIIFRSATPSWATKLGGKWSWWISRVQAGPLWDDACWREERGPTCVQTASSRHQGQRHQTILSVQVNWNKRSYVYHFISSSLFIPGMEDIGMSTTLFITKLSSSRARQQKTFDILCRLMVGSSESIRNGERTPTSRYWRRQHRLAKQSWWSWQTRRRHVSQDVRDAITPSKEGGSGADRSDFSVILKQINYFISRYSWKRKKKTEKPCTFL